MEQDNEVSGNGNSYTTEFRQYDPRLGRWKSLDPVVQVWESPYNGMFNSSIALSDPDGADPIRPSKHVDGATRRQIRREMRYTKRQGRRDIRNGQTNTNAAQFLTWYRQVRFEDQNRINARRTIHYIGHYHAVSGNSISNVPWGGPPGPGPQGPLRDNQNRRYEPRNKNGNGIFDNPTILYYMPKLVIQKTRTDRYWSGKLDNGARTLDRSITFRNDRNYIGGTFKYWEGMDHQNLTSFTLRITDFSGTNLYLNTFTDVAPKFLFTVPPLVADLTGNLNLPAGSRIRGVTISVNYSFSEPTVPNDVLIIKMTRTISKSRSFEGLAGFFRRIFNK